MARISYKLHGSFKNTNAFLNKMDKGDIFKNLERYAEEGVSALSSATPVDTGLAASSWGYVVEYTKGAFRIIWTNSNIENGFPVAIMLQYGHGTGTGGYVQGQDYINPAIRPIFDKIAERVWKEVTSA